MSKFAIITVTTTRDYVVEMADDTYTMIDGATLTELTEEWFRDYPMDRHHATRDTCHHFGTQVVTGVKTKIVSPENTSNV